MSTRDQAPHIRPYRAYDLDTLYEICLRTGASGDDASALVEDPRLFGELFAVPYATLEPAHAFVLDDGNGVAVGYVLGALDTVDFERRCEEAWWPPLRAQHPIQPGGKRLDDLLIHLIHHRPTAAPADTDGYPSHLHIDLLAHLQGAGWGRKLMDTVFDALRADGSPGVHWGVSARNERALGFYRHLGFAELSDNAAIVTFGQLL